jgi:hypothetical protein
MSGSVLNNSNKFLLALLVTAYGTLLFNIQIGFNLRYPGILLISIILMVFPVIFLLFFKSELFSHYRLFLLAIIPLIPYNYIMYITMGVPVGYTDPHIHILQCYNFINSEGYLQMIPGLTDRMSLNFVGLYTICHFINVVTSLQLPTIASAFPPLFNLVLILSVYLIVSKLFNPNIGIIAMILYGWENQVLNFGQELRTQTIGTLFIYMLLFLYLYMWYNKDKQFSVKCLLIVLSLAIVASHFVSIVNAVFILTCMAGTMLVIQLLSKKREYEHFTLVSINLVLVVFFIIYMLYIGQSFSSIADAVTILLQSAVDSAESEATVSVSKNVGQLIFGKFVQITYYIFWGLFIIGAPIYLYSAIKSKKKYQLVLMISFMAYLFFFASYCLFGSLSMGRVYVVGYLVIVTVVASLKYNLKSLNIDDNRGYGRSITIIIVCILLLLVIASVIKLPQYVIGDTRPLRDLSPIDDVPYWSGDQPSYRAQEYLDRNLISQYQTVSYHVIVNKYYMRSTYEVQPELKDTKVHLLHNKFQGCMYPLRGKLPSLSSFDNSNMIYSNEDYIAFID